MVLYYFFNKDTYFYLNYYQKYACNIYKSKDYSSKFYKKVIISKNFNQNNGLV